MDTINWILIVQVTFYIFSPHDFLFRILGRLLHLEIVSKICRTVFVMIDSMMYKKYQSQLGKKYTFWNKSYYFQKFTSWNLSKTP